MIDRAIGLVGIALAIIFGVWSLAPDGWPKMEPWAIQAGLLVGVALIGLAIGLIVSDKRNPKAETLADTAEIQLHFFGDDRTPSRLSFSNIWRWYTLRNIVRSINPLTGSHRTEHVFVTLFLTFEKPVKIGTLEVGSPDGVLPTYEVKDFNNRSAVVAFTSEIPACTVYVRVHE
jgi:hypothetical protein